MSERFQDTLAAAAADPLRFRGLTFSGKKGSLRVTARPIRLKGAPAVSVTRAEDGRTATHNFRWPDWQDQVRRLVEKSGFSFFHVRRDDGDWHVRLARSGRVLLSRGKPPAAPAPEPASHDRPKAYAITPENAPAFLRSLDALDEAGRIRPAMQAKYRQINGFLALLEPILPPAPPPAYAVCDCGCGSAHLSFAVFDYLRRLRGFPATLHGVDINPDLIAKNIAWRDRLAWPGMTFETADIAAFEPPAPPDLVLSLHACDTASDLAFARAVRWKSAAVIAVPCCRHDMARDLDAPPFRALLRHGILRERLADLVNDALRAAALRACGYSVRVIEFASHADTARNVLIRAVRRPGPPDPTALAEYHALKTFWNVTPAIEPLLGAALPLFSL